MKVVFTRATVALRIFQLWEHAANRQASWSGVCIIGQSGNPLQSKLDAATVDAKNFQENAEAKLKNAELWLLKELQNTASQLIDWFQSVNRGASRLSWYAAAYLWGWFLLMPCAILFYALTL